MEFFLKIIPSWEQKATKLLKMNPQKLHVQRIKWKPHVENAL
jgi:hypothetical protein